MAHLAQDRLAGMQADRDPQGLAQLDREPSWLSTSSASAMARAAVRAEGTASWAVGDAEQRHDAVADELVDLAAGRSTTSPMAAK
ncbi:MAG: hypothetical protein U1E17_01605 [Geminicoccaceae bacterium]